MLAGLGLLVQEDPNHNEHACHNSSYQESHSNDGTGIQRPLGIRREDPLGCLDSISSLQDADSTKQAHNCRIARRQSHFEHVVRLVAVSNISSSEDVVTNFVCESLNLSGR